jgi:hypothetical protein
MRTSGFREEPDMAAKLMLASALPANPSLEQLRKQAKEFRNGSGLATPNSLISPAR